MFYLKWYKLKFLTSNMVYILYQISEIRLRKLVTTTKANDVHKILKPFLPRVDIFTYIFIAQS